jgi:hypothetical protein
VTNFELKQPGAEQLARAMRDDYDKDPQGRPIRTKHVPKGNLFDSVSELQLIVTSTSLNNSGICDATPIPPALAGSTCFGFAAKL